MAIMRAFCSSQNCTVRRSWMRLSSSSGSRVGRLQAPMLPIAPRGLLDAAPDPPALANGGTALLAAFSQSWNRPTPAALMLAKAWVASLAAC